MVITHLLTPTSAMWTLTAISQLIAAGCTELHPMSMFVLTAARIPKSAQIYSQHLFPTFVNPSGVLREGCPYARFQKLKVHCCGPLSYSLHSLISSWKLTLMECHFIPCHFIPSIRNMFSSITFSVTVFISEESGLYDTLNY